MKVILYLADSLTPSAIANPKIKNKFHNMKLANNFINKLSKRSIYFSNSYGYGDTFASTTPIMTGENPYKSYSDSFFLFNSFRAKNNLSLFFKSKNFYNIYYTNLPTNSKISNNEYERYYNLATENYDLKVIKKKNLQYSFRNFIKDINIKEIQNKYKNTFYFLHECLLHDDPKVYRNSDPKTYIKAVNKLSKLFEQQLKLINYDPKKDILYFLSDHGLLFRPYDQIYFNNDLTNQEYDNYYKENLNNDKMQTCFFINNPNQKFLYINDYTTPENVFHYIKKNYLNLKKKTQLRVIKNKSIIISSKSGFKSPYLNIFDKHCFHNHFLYISKYKKILFSKKHPEKFFDVINNKILVRNFNKKLLLTIKNYYSFFNIIKKIVLFLLSFLIKIKNKLISISLKLF
jgi:hypothetical protein